MTSSDPCFDKAMLSDSSNNLVDGVDSEAKGMNWIIEHLPLTVFRVSSKSSWGIEYINKNVEKLTGYSKTDFITRELSWFDIVFPEDVPIIEKTVEKAKRSKISYQVEYRIKKSDGDTAFILEKAHLVHDNKGKLAFIEGIFLDVTAQVKQREDSQKALISSIPKPSIAFYVDMSGKIKHTNDYFLEIYKLKSVDEALGMEIRDFLETDTKTITEKVMESGKAVHNQEAYVKFKVLDKPLFTAVSSVPVIDESGAAMGIFTIVTDMTEMKEKEKDAQGILNYSNTCLKDLGEGIKKIGEGNLDIHLEKVRDDEFGKTFDEFNKFVINLKLLIESALQDMTITLEEARRAEEAANQMNIGMQQISTAAEQISTGAENLSRYAGTASSDVKASQEIFKKLRQSSNKSSNYASQAGRTSEEAQGLGNMAQEDMGQFAAEISKLGNIIQSLDNAVNNIGAVTGKIKSIADQTNLLALNAAIEAARAGEYGRGFAVVADEVRKLAADSRKSTDDINGIVTNVQKETKKVTEAIAKAQASVETGNKNIKKALSKSLEITNDVNTINSMLAELDKLAEEGLVKIESIDKSISEAASTAEENTANSEETSAAIQEQTAALQQVNTSSQNVSSLAQKTVDTLMENFKVSAEGRTSQNSLGKLQHRERKGSLKKY
ncbi:MAG: methyl-accepting chemotaxis protein [Methanosarcina sp.]|nr:chemotaxis protein [Methanosarcina sp. Ant1]